MWAALIKKYWGLSLFKETPANTPYSMVLLVGLGLFYFLLIIVQWMLTDVKDELTLSVAVAAAGSLVVSYVAYTYILLLVFHVFSRFIQTLTCLIAAHTIVHLFALPLLLAAPLLAESTSSQPIGVLIGVVFLVLTLILTVWQFMLSAYIYKKALDIENLPAFLASLGLLGSNILIVSFWR